MTACSAHWAYRTVWLGHRTTIAARERRQHGSRISIAPAGDATSSDPHPLGGVPLVSTDLVTYKSRSGHQVRLLMALIDAKNSFGRAESSHSVSWARIKILVWDALYRLSHQLCNPLGARDAADDTHLIHICRHRVDVVAYQRPALDQSWDAKQIARWLRQPCIMKE